jgi:hypothetical protein
VRTKPRRNFGSLLLMRKPWLGSRKRVASVSGSLDVDGAVERARSTDRLSDLSNSETSTHAESAFHLSGGSTTSVAHVLNGRARYAEPNLASFPQERLRPPHLVDAATTSAASASGPGMDHAESALRISVTSVAVQKGSLGSGPASWLPLAPRGAHS